MNFAPFFYLKAVHTAESDAEYRVNFLLSLTEKAGYNSGTLRYCLNIALVYIRFHTAAELSCGRNNFDSFVIKKSTNYIDIFFLSIYN